MERFNSQLYEKYVKLKKGKFSKIEENDQKRISDIWQCQSAMEQLIEDLKNQNDKLRLEILTTQEQFQECRKLVLEENQKSKMLFSEIGTLKELLLQKNDNPDRSRGSYPSSCPNISLEDSGECLLKENNIDSVQVKNAVLCEKSTAFTLHESNNDNRLVPECCKKTKVNSGDGNGINFSPCAFHILMELLVGMNFSVECQNEGSYVSVIHQKSGYNFTLSWIRDKAGEGELFYRVSSLGTLETIALDWMKEDMVFSMTMCPVFFDRLSQVIGYKL